jgi:hypothetical protein
MLAGWEGFYQVTGEGAATLTGLLFLAATLTSGRNTESLIQGMRLFSTPTVVKFVTVVVASALALTPHAYEGLAAAGLAALGLFGLGYGARICLGLHRSANVPHWSDYWFYGFGPTAAHAGLGLSGLMVLARQPYGDLGLAASTLALLVLAIRNAWDLVTWLAPRRDQL